MAMSQKRLLSTCRHILREWFHVDFDAQPEAVRQTLMAAAETASRMKQSEKHAVEEAFRGLVTAKLGDA